MSSSIFAFCVMLGVSFIFSTLVSRIPLLRIPMSVGYLCFGMLLHGNWVPLSPGTTAWVHALGEFGLIFLMFVSGLEVDFRLLHPRHAKEHPVNPLWVGFMVLCSTFLLSFLCCLPVHWWYGSNVNPYFLALLFSTTSLGIILPVLDEARIVHTLLGQTLLVSALLADFATLVLVSVFVSRAEGASLLRVAIALVVLPMTALLYISLRRMQRFAFAKSLAGDASNRIRAILALLAGMCAFADFTGAEPILGSFAAGMLVSVMPFASKTKIKDYIHGIGYGFLIPVFFLSVGLNFHLNELRTGDTWVWCAILFTVAMTVKLLPATFLVSVFGKRNSLAGGFLLCSRLSLPVAASQIGVSVGALPQSLANIVVLVALLTSLAAPMLFLTALRQERTA